MRLIDVAPVIFPAYQDSSAALRSLSANKDAPLGDVKRLAAQGALRQLFQRSDAPRRTPAQAAAYLLTRQRDSWVGRR